MSHRENKKMILGNSPIFSLSIFLKTMILQLYEFVVRGFLDVFPPKVEKKEYYFSICTCFKNEAPNLKEWIEYHKLIGVDHFYIYNNNSTDNYREVLAPYIDEGCVTLVDFPRTPIQPYCYEHWINNYRSESTWLALTDIDEYFVPLKENNIKDWLEKWKKYPIILVYWKMFGTSGRIEHDSYKLITEQYTNCWPKLYDCGKIIYNTDYDINVNVGMHHFNIAHKGWLKILPVNQWGKFVLSDVNRYSDKELDIQLNHYWSGSYGKYVEKQGRGDSAFATSWHNFDAFLSHEQHNTSIDMSIYRFMVQLKLKMMGKYPEHN